MVDFMRPDGTPVMRTIADYRQVNDALFHAGLNSGSQYEWQDTPNRLHFYIVDFRKDAGGILSYTLGVRSLDGSGPQTRGLTLTPPPAQSMPALSSECSFTLKNTGTAAPVAASLHPQDAASYLDSDIYRLSVSVEGKGWTAQLPNALAAVKFGDAQPIAVNVTRSQGSAASARVTLSAVSESDPARIATATCVISSAKIRR